MAHAEVQQKTVEGLLLLIANERDLDVEVTDLTLEIPRIAFRPFARKRLGNKYYLGKNKTSGIFF